MHLRYAFILALRHIKRNKVLFVSLVGIIIFSISFYLLALYYIQQSTYNLTQQLKHVNFVVSIDSTDITQSVKVLSMSPLIDSVSVITPQESSRLIENELGNVLDSLEEVPYQAILVIQPSLHCTETLHFTEIIDLCERLPLTDNVLYSSKEYGIYLQMRNYSQMTLLFIGVFFVIGVLITSLYCTKILGYRVKEDSFIFSQSGSKPLFNSLPWILFYISSLFIGYIVGISAFFTIIYFQRELISAVQNTSHSLFLYSTFALHTAILLGTIFFTYTIASRNLFWKIKTV